MSDHVRFTYHLQAAGNASASLHVFDQSLQFEITNISNPLYDLLRGLVGMITEPKHLWDEENVCWVDWFGESSCYKWMLSTFDGKEVQVKIVFCSDIFDDAGSRVALNRSCGFMEFCRAIILELDAFIKELGLLNYEQLWRQGEFPLTYFLIIKKYLIEHELWTSSSGDHINLLDEIEILKA